MSSIRDHLASPITILTILTGLSSLLALISTLTYNVNLNLLPYSTDASAYFFASSLPMTYWVGLAIVVFAVAYSVYAGRSRFGYLEVGLLCGYLWVIPHLLFSSPYYPDGYFHMWATEAVMRSASISPVPYPPTSYTAWNEAQGYILNQIFYGVFWKSLGISPIAFMWLWQFVEIAILLVMVSALGMVLGAGRFGFLAPVPFLALDWQFNLDLEVSSNSLGTIAAIALLILVVRLVKRGSVSRTEGVCLAILAIGCVAFDPAVQFLTLVGMISILGFLWVNHKVSKFVPFSISFLILSTVYFFFSAAYKAFSLPAILTSILSLLRRTSSPLAALPPMPSESFALVTRLRELQLGGWLVIMLVASVLVYRLGSGRLKFGVVISWVMGFFLLFPATSSIPARIFEYAPIFGGAMLPATFSSLHTRKRFVLLIRALVLALILFGAFVLPITAYAGATYEYTSHYDLVQAQFYSNYFTPSRVYEATEPSVIAISLWDGSQPIYGTGNNPLVITEGVSRSGQLLISYNRTVAEEYNAILYPSGWDFYRLQYSDQNLSAQVASVERSMADSLNIIFSDGITRIYSG